MQPTSMATYRHYKGGTYTLLMVATSSDDKDTELAVYVSHKTQTVWVRELAEFLEVMLWPDGVMRKRFTLESEVHLCSH